MTALDSDLNTKHLLQDFRDSRDRVGTLTGAEC
jgi:hypothetical protein